MRSSGILLCLLLTAVRSAGRYVVLIPAELRTGSPENVCVLMLPGAQSCALTLTIQNLETNTTLLQQDLQANSGHNCFRFTVDDGEIDSDSVSLVKVTVRGAGEGLTVNDSRMVILKRYNSLTFVQTDKAVYKPSQTVKFRIVSLTENFSPIEEKYPLVSLWDPNSNRIGQWRDVEPNHGIADLSFDLLPEPIHGLYRIEVQAKSGKTQHHFSVEEYVLPKAEVKVKMPKEITMLEPKLHIEVCGSYTFGKPVKGFVNGSVCLQYDASPHACHSFTGQTDSNGCLSESLSMKLFRFNRRHYSRRLFARIVLKEEGTGIEMEAFGETDVTSEITRLEFKHMEKYYKTGLPYTGEVQLEYSTGGPLSNATIYLFNSLTPGAEKIITDDEGIARFTLDTSSWGSTPISFMAIYQASHQEYRFRTLLPHHEAAQHQALPFYSVSGSYLTIKKKQQQLTCASQLEVPVHYIIGSQLPAATQSLDVFYLVMSKGLIVSLKMVSIPIGKDKGEVGQIELSIPIGMANSPVLRLLVFSVLPDGETIGDSAKFEVSKCFSNQVSLEFSVPRELPKGPVSLDVKAAAHSLCGLRVVDKSVLLLKPETELSRDSVYSLLPVLDSTGYHYRVPESDYEYCRHQDPRAEPISSGDQSGDIFHLLQDMGLKILTDTDYRKPIECEISEYIVMNYGVMSSRFFAHSPPSQDVRTGMSSPEQAPFTDVRKYFPETWIWQLVPVGSSGSASLPLTVPDSITEWKGSTFCTGAAGFGISETVSFNAFKPFFVELGLPYSVIRTEVFTLKAKVFNFLKSCIMVKVKLIEAQGFNVNAESSNEYKSCVCSKDSVTISWKLEATKLGEHNITVRAESIPSDTPCGNEVVTVPDKGAIDVIRKALLIKPEGTETELTHSSLICPKGMSVKEQIPLQVPEDVVEGSSRAYITVLGDILGSAMENLDGLLRLPTGCGEQNMVKFAPNIYVLRYLNKTNQLTGQILERTTGYLRTGYQNQLRYKHSDGSFSAFGDNDPEGNTWLTAFVLRSFLEARQHISIQEEILRKSAQFFLKHQLVSGCFASLGQLFNNAMKGGVDDLISLSAYVTTTLLQLERNNPDLANDVYTKQLVDFTLPEHQSDYKEWDESTRMPTFTPLAVGTADFKTGVTDRALSCLTDALGTVNNTYTLSLLAYTFTLAGDQLNRGKVLQRLEELAIRKDGLTHWQRKEKPEEDRGYWWRAPSAEVEMTAYVLLALLSQPQVPPSDLDQATSIVGWLVKQRNSYGGFASTQDTVVALQALALYAELTHVIDPHSSLSISSTNGFHREFHIDSSNQLLLQVQPLAEVPGDYSVEVSGTSCLLLQTTLRYNVPAKQKEEVFRLSVQMMATGTKERNNLEGPKYKININVTFTGQRPESNMVLVDVMMLSGFSAVRESYKDSMDRQNISKSEIHDGHMVLYLQPMKSNRLLQLSILTVQDFEVENLQPAVVKVYDYYETDESVVAEYEAPKGSEIV